MVKAIASPPTRPITDALRSAIVASGLSMYARATAAGVDVGTLGRFVRGECGMKLASADLLFATLGLSMANGQAGAASARLLPTAAILAAIAASGFGPSKLAAMSGVHHGAIRKFTDGTLGIELTSADRLATALGLVVIQGERPAVVRPSRPISDDQRPISDAILTGLASKGLDADELAVATGVRPQRLQSFMERRTDAKLATADRICEYLGIGFAVGPADPPAVPSEALHIGIKSSGLSARKLAKLTGVVYQAIQGFIDRRVGLELVSADRIAAAVGLTPRLGQVARPPGPPPPVVPFIPYLDGLRAATKATGFSVYKLSSLSGLAEPSIARFLKGENNLATASIVKLAGSVGFDPQSSDASRHCPVKLAGEGLPIILDGKTTLPDMSGDAYKMLDLLVQGFIAGRKIPLFELAAMSGSKRIRPLKDALDRRGFEPLRDRIRETKDGRNKYLEIIDINPRL
jgi:plasmid maintenance system antidote protein VapI